MRAVFQKKSPSMQAADVIAHVVVKEVRCSAAPATLAALAASLRSSNLHPTGQAHTLMALYRRGALQGVLSHLICGGVLCGCSLLLYQEPWSRGPIQHLHLIAKQHWIEPF